LSADRPWSIGVKETAMSRINTFRAPGEAKATDPADETVINGARYGADKAIRSRAENVATPVDAPDPRVAEAIKRRQISLALRYVAAVRAR
jgi:hypothetical protein